MKAVDVITAASTDRVSFSQDQKREIRARMRFAELSETEELSDGEAEILKNLVQAVCSPLATERTASYFKASGNCPRCGTSVSAVKLADQSDAAYCNSCHVVVPG